MCAGRQTTTLDGHPALPSTGVLTYLYGRRYKSYVVCAALVELTHPPLSRSRARLLEGRASEFHKRRFSEFASSRVHEKLATAAPDGLKSAEWWTGLGRQSRANRLTPACPHEAAERHFDTRATRPWLALACVQKPCLNFLSKISSKPDMRDQCLHPHGAGDCDCPIWNPKWDSSVRVRARVR
jgi:hypothetical protein